MLIYLTFLSKEWIELKQSKKFLLYLCLSLFLPFIVNLIATNPMISMDIIAPLYVVVSACVVAELIRASLIEEFNLSTFDNLLTAPFEKGYLIFFKTTIPILISFCATVLGLILSDVFFLLIPTFDFFAPMATFFNIITALIASCVCGWVSFYLSIRTSSTSSASHTLSLGMIMMTIGIFAVVSKIYSYVIIIIFGCVILFLTYAICKVKLTSPQPLKKGNTHPCFCFFKGQNLTFISAIIVKDFSTIRISHLVENFFYIATIFMIKTPIIFYGILFLLTTFGTRKLLYQNIVDEKLNKTSDILRLHKSDFYIYMSKTIVPTIVSLILSLLAIVISSRSISDVYFALIVILLSPILAYPITLFVNRPKEISIGNLLLSVVLLFVYAILFFMIYV